ncbi:MAG: hypothetical protein JSV12_03245 [Candidatus Bathyarchaeota archaeon]|nr:MAG: hypothetical protein JSV12_03245 [Candidatus Bathyarchaeota archaeon]
MKSELIFVCFILLFFGASLFFRSVVALLFSALLTFLTAKVIKEEEHLAKQYGDAYREYMKKVRWKLIPKIW